MLGEECGEPGVRDVRFDQGWDLLTAQGRLGELVGDTAGDVPRPRVCAGARRPGPGADRRGRQGPRPPRWSRHC